MRPRNRPPQTRSEHSTLQPTREKEVLSNAETNDRGPLSNPAIRRLFERIIDEARSADRIAMAHEASPREDKNWNRRQSSNAS